MAHQPGIEEKRQRIADVQQRERDQVRQTVRMADGTDREIFAPGKTHDEIVALMIGGGQMSQADIEADLNFQDAQAVSPGQAVLLGMGGLIDTAGARAEVAISSLQDAVVPRQARMELDQDRLALARAAIAEEEGVIAPVRELNPASVGLGESLPTTLVPGGRVAQSIGAGIEGMLLNPESPGTGALLTAGLGDIGQRIGQAGMRGFNRQLGSMAQRQARRTGSRRAQEIADRAFLEGEGVRVTRSQRSEPGQLFEAGLQAIPIVAGVSRASARAQAKSVNRGFANLFGKDFDNLKIQRRAEIDEQFGVDYQRVEDAIEPTLLDPRVANAVDEFGILTTSERKLIRDGEPLSGDALLRVRRAVNDQLSRDAAAGNTIAVNKLRDVMEVVESQVADNIQDPEMLKLFRDTNRRYKIWSAARKGKAISNEGDINVQTLVNNLRRAYAGFDVGRDLPGDQAGFGRILNAISALPDPIPTSGSAERAGMAGLISAVPAMLGSGSSQEVAGALIAGAGFPLALALMESQVSGAAAGGLIGRSAAGLISDEIQETGDDVREIERRQRRRRQR